MADLCVVQVGFTTLSFTSMNVVEWKESLVYFACSLLVAFTNLYEAGAHENLQ